ncbi:hypothetical protein [Alienimonas californiensis]|uniref:Uncharacterized protein n=1 Tax=Alienimonas californiensis TaxID=2527989 RepID=A0A517PF63_9PLAN|nr:hypothetical protein [Alienimonas californiensis]QDT18009.1 hypothetical protein CA12_41470 [Alienimonas californiensis]
MSTGAVLLFALLPPWGGATPLLVDAAPRKATLLPGEPLVAEVRLTNPTDAAIAFDLGLNALEAFHVTVRDAAGRAVQTSKPIRFGGGAHSIGRYFAPPHRGRHRASLVLNRWVSTRHPPGRYSVTVHVRPVQNRWERLGLADSDPDPISVRADATFHLTIGPPDEAALRELFHRLKDRLLDPRLDPAEQDVVRASLFETDAPAAVEALDELTSAPTPPGGRLGRWEMDGLRRAATQALRRIE